MLAKLLALICRYRWHHWLLSGEDYWYCSRCAAVVLVTDAERRQWRINQEAISND